MRLTRSADYALRAMIYLSGLPAGVPASGAIVAKATGVAEPFLLKVLRQLVQARLIQAQRGAKGGFQLALPAEQISMLRVIEAIDGPLDPRTCLIDDQPCNRKPWCGVHVVLADLQAQAVRELQRTSIDRLRRESDIRREFLASRLERQCSGPSAA
jgi:Rrf2 family protein